MDARWYCSMVYDLWNFDQRIKINEISNVHGGIAVCIIGVLWYLSRKYISGAIVDWPSGKFNGIIDLYIPVYGVFWLQ